MIHPDTCTWLMHKLITAHNDPKTLARRNHPSELLPPPARELPLIRLHDLRHLHATLFSGGRAGPCGGQQARAQ